MPLHATQILARDYHSAHPAKTLVSLLGIRWWQLLLYWFVFLLKAAPLMLMPVYLEWTIGFARQPGEGWLFWTINAAFMLILLQNVVSHQIYVRLTHRHIRGMELGLRAALVRRLQQLSISWHIRSTSGALQSKVLRDVESIVNMAMQFFHFGTSALMMLVWAMLLTFTRDPMIGLFFLIGCPIGAVLVQIFRKRMNEHNRRYRTGLEKMSAWVAEMIDTIPVTRAHAVEEHEIGRSEHFLGEVRNAAMDIDRTNQLFAAAAWVAMQAAVVVSVAVTTWLVISGYMPIERIMLYYSLFGMVVGSIVQLLSFMPIISSGLESMRSVGEVLECPDLEWNQGKRCIEQVRGDICFENVHFTYQSAGEGEADRVTAIKGLDLTILAGECVAFVGESGSGKSTAMNLTIGFYRPQQGRILLDGIDQRELDLRSWRRQIAVVPQNTILFSDSLRNNITYGLGEIDDQRLWEAIDAANLRKLIAELPEGLETQVGENGMTLSGGQRQRVAIARALVRDPRIIILDEATSALDVISEREVQEAIDNMVTGRTVLIVAHRLSTIRKADRVVVMKEGRCIELGTQQELVDQGGEFSRLKRLQA
jgi:ATP-binding cassette subfamily B protein